MKLQDLPLAKILVPADRSRAVDEDYALAIQTEIVAGTFIDPILVRPTPRATRPYTLIDGAHRLRAVDLNGETEITCLIVDASKADADRMEVAANLFRHELTALDRAIAVQLYRRAWEEKYGLIERGGDQSVKLTLCPLDTIADEAERGFAATCAERLGLSKSAIMRAQRIATKLPQALITALRATCYADNQSVLLKLTDLDEARKNAIADWIAAGNDPGAIVDEALNGSSKEQSQPSMKARNAAISSLQRLEGTARRDALLEIVNLFRADIEWALEQVSAGGGSLQTIARSRSSS
jgi:ParB family chromosome partitioning protein